MGKMGYGYGSECHLLRWMGRHRKQFDAEVLLALEASRGSLEWLDFGFDKKRIWPDAEWQGLDFLPADDPVRTQWEAERWPSSGNVQNWDAVGKVRVGGNNDEWVLVEAKTHIGEIGSECKAKPQGSLSAITRTLGETVVSIGAKCDVSAWLKPYYQYANRLAVLDHLHQHHIPSKLLFVYFTGDLRGQSRNSPQTADEWLAAIRECKRHLGIEEGHSLAEFVRELFLPVVSIEV